ncbi:hypothetical protein PV721_14900 [Streptomyces sp. MB09-01]|uniref:hypothetical protein n=1 Tax=Streptomyces sp. MB09-01 TaxID=3028666 RepID=UPI0029B7AEE8|nr:hypothetical protein [Streptomyces sp. MB09-01]MDX3535623.1 hypothetical protein [Streptomyces sp. MB09-01]
MVPEALAALAAAGGTAVVQAAGQDVWDGFRLQLARWFGRGDADRERSELQRLDQTSQALHSAEGAEAEGVRVRQEAAWATRIESLLEGLDDRERTGAANALQSLLTEAGPGGRQVTAGPGGAAAGGDITVTADDGSIAAWSIHGGAHIGTPPQQQPPRAQGDDPSSPHPPDPSQG